MQSGFTTDHIYRVNIVIMINLNNFPQTFNIVRKPKEFRTNLWIR